MLHYLAEGIVVPVHAGESDRRPKAYSYVRFSTKRQAKGDSLQRQLDRSRSYSAEFNLDLQEVSYEDLGVSAFDRANVTTGRLSAFIQAAESGAIERGSYLLVENLDRLSRADLSDGIALLDRLVKLGIRVVTLIDKKVLDEESIKDPMCLFWAVMILIRANEESTTKSDRVSKAHKRKRDNHVPFAFGQGPGWLQPNATKTGWEVIPAKVESVVKVFEHAARGIGSTAIARIANREGWPVPGKAKDWHKTLPHKLLHNRRVLGELEPQVKDGKVRRRTGECWAIIIRSSSPSTYSMRRKHLPSDAETCRSVATAGTTTFSKDSYAAVTVGQHSPASQRVAIATALAMPCMCAPTGIEG